MGYFWRWHAEFFSTFGGFITNIRWRQQIVTTCLRKKKEGRWKWNEEWWQWKWRILLPALTSLSVTQQCRPPAGGVEGVQHGMHNFMPLWKHFPSYLLKIPLEWRASELQQRWKWGEQLVLGRRAGLEGKALGITALKGWFAVRINVPLSLGRFK